MEVDSPCLPNYWSQDQRMSMTYLPALPARPTHVGLEYAKAVNEAPMAALRGVLVDGRQKPSFTVSPACRMRQQVGQTNRWRLPQTLGSDLLGSSQAARAISVTLNRSMRKIMTAENPRHAVNLDIEKPYRFLVDGGRPHISTTSHEHNDAASSSHRTSRPLKEGDGSSFVITPLQPSRHLNSFRYNSPNNFSQVAPDIILKCLHMNWELHRTYFSKSQTLADLLQNAEKPSHKRYYRNRQSDKLDELINNSQFYSAEYQDGAQKMCSDAIITDIDDIKGSSIDHPKHVSEQRVNNVTVISLNVTDPLITTQALAIALGNLYYDELKVDEEDVSGVYATALLLQYSKLVDKCTEIIFQTITCSTVCKYHQSASTYRQEKVRFACERWLELKLVPKLSQNIHLKEIPMELLQKTLVSNKLFMYNEYCLYRVLACWVYLEMNPEVIIMPSYYSVVMFFYSLAKSTSLIEREEGQHFTMLFMALRLHGITNMNDLQDIQAMNIIPQAWVVRMLSQHYEALQAGGDMLNMCNFNMYAIRQGFILESEPHFHCEIFSLHGFHFELKAARQRDSRTYLIRMQRMHPSNTALSFGASDRHSFSMRFERSACYSIMAQYQEDDGAYQCFSTRMLDQRFGLSTKTKSQALLLREVVPPLYITFWVLFPSV